jgi:hypothetical protein
MKASYETLMCLQFIEDQWRADNKLIEVNSSNNNNNNNGFSSIININSIPSDINNTQMSLYRTHLASSLLQQQQRLEQERQLNLTEYLKQKQQIIESQTKQKDEMFFHVIKQQELAHEQRNKQQDNMILQFLKQKDENEKEYRKSNESILMEYMKTRDSVFKELDGTSNQLFNQLTTQTQVSQTVLDVTRPLLQSNNDQQSLPASNNMNI